MDFPFSKIGDIDNTKLPIRYESNLSPPWPIGRENKMFNKPTPELTSWESWEIMQKIREVLGKNGLRAVFQKSGTQIGRYCQGPACQDRQRNPVDRMRMLAERIHNSGQTELAIITINYIAEPLACRLQPISCPNPDKQNIAEECLDDYPEKTKLDELILKNANPNAVMLQAEKCKREIDETVELFKRTYSQKILLYKKSG